LPGEQNKLKDFRCSKGGRAQNLVEEWVRKKACGWARSSAARQLRFLVDEDDQVLGVLAFEPGDLPETWFVPIAAVHLNLQHPEHPEGEGDEPRPSWGTDLFQTCLDEMRGLTPEGSVYWKVALDNDERPHRMSRAVGADDPEPEFPDDPKNKHLVYSISFY